MTKIEKKYPETLLTATMIAPCGMNCGLCHGFLREKKSCLGCNGDDVNKPKYCVGCKIKNCDGMDTCDNKFCYECRKFPCARLRQLDKRYRTKYKMSMIANLEHIRDFGLDSLVAGEKKKWKCPGCGGVICVHKNECIYCGHII